MSYLELLKLAAPEAIVVVAALAVLTIGLTTARALVLGPIVAVLGVALAIGAVVMLPSHAILFGGMSWTTALAAIGQKLAGAPVQPLLAVGIVMTLIGFAFKIAAAPFHLWAPDAYQGAPIPSAAFIASGSKVASFVVLGKIVLIGFGPV